LISFGYHQNFCSSRACERAVTTGLAEAIYVGGITNSSKNMGTTIYGMIAQY
jgi:hypothetical protein